MVKKIVAEALKITHVATDGIEMDMMLPISMEADNPDRHAVLRAWCHAANIGRIVFALADHDVGDWGDCSINDPIVSIIDQGEPARVLLQALADMSEETAAGICKQL